VFSLDFCLFYGKLEHISLCLENHRILLQEYWDLKIQRKSCWLYLRSATIIAIALELKNLWICYSEAIKI